MVTRMVMRVRANVQSEYATTLTDVALCPVRFLTPIARVAMALSKLSGDEQRIVFTQLCNVLDPRVAVYLSSANSGLWELTQALLQ